jgi:hypothetical protein
MGLIRFFKRRIKRKNDKKKTKSEYLATNIVILGLDSELKKLENNESVKQRVQSLVGNYSSTPTDTEKNDKLVATTKVILDRLKTIRNGVALSNKYLLSCSEKLDYYKGRAKYGGKAGASTYKIILNKYTGYIKKLKYLRRKYGDLLIQENVELLSNNIQIKFNKGKYKNPLIAFSLVFTFIKSVLIMYIPIIKRIIYQILKNQIIISIMLASGIYTVYLCKVSQANLLRTKWNTIDTIEKTATININQTCDNLKLFCDSDSMKSEKIHFNIKDSRNTRDYIIDLLISMRGKHYSPPILLYISTILEKVIHINYKLLNKIMIIVNKYIPEPLIILFGGLPLLIYLGVALLINSIYLPYLMIMSFRYLLLANIGNEKYGLASWGNIGLFSIKDWFIGFLSIGLVCTIVGPFALKVGPVLSLFVALYGLITPSLFVAIKNKTNENYTLKNIYKDSYKYKKIFIVFFWILTNLYLFYNFFNNKYVKYIIIIICIIVIKQMYKRTLLSSPNDNMTKLSSYEQSQKTTIPDKELVPPSLFSIFSKFGEIFSRFSETVVQDSNVQEYNMSSNVNRYNKPHYKN